MGNPAFGHSGEKAISYYFTDGEGAKYKEWLSGSKANQQWSDLINFEGNANALRLLTNQFLSRRKGGYALTYATLASIIKYPCASTEADGSTISRKKYGYFSSETDTMLKIAEECGLLQLNANKTTEMPVFARHPLVYLVEAADDICYSMIDI